MAVDQITMKFARKIADEEWDDFRKRQMDAIRSRTTRRTGRLENDRQYTVKEEGAAKIVMGLKHPGHERAIDMQRYYQGDVKKRFGTAKDVFYKRKGRPIHNRIIWGKLNPLSFRLMNELQMEVREQFRKAFDSIGDIEIVI